jgi:hypothetical protein
MKRLLMIGTIPAALLLTLAISRSAGPIYAQAAAKAAPHIGEGGVPQFEKDPAWPKVPSKWKMGFGSAVVGDEQGHVWILSRPKTLAHPRTTAPDLTSVPAPPVMEFDQAGTFIQGWGGEAAGYQWPSNEHGMTVVRRLRLDRRQRRRQVEQSGRSPNDNQIRSSPSPESSSRLRQERPDRQQQDGSAKGATSLFYYAKANELFVSDGYSNARIMVYDADTGKVKRMWGAYGGKPLDQEDRPQASEPRPIPWLRVSESLQQFASPVHDVRVSNDNLVYVADRGNKRIQVFTPEGRFIAEQFIGWTAEPLQARGTAFSPDPEQRFLYVAGTPRCSF